MFDDELIDSDKPYDAFISYSHHDADFVNEVIHILRSYSIYLSVKVPKKGD